MVKVGIRGRDVVKIIVKKNDQLSLKKTNIRRQDMRGHCLKAFWD